MERKTRNEKRSDKSISTERGKNLPPRAPAAAFSRMVLRSGHSMREKMEPATRRRPAGAAGALDMMTSITSSGQTTWQHLKRPKETSP